VWCNSKTAITDMSMFFDFASQQKPMDSASKSALCYLAYFTGGSTMFQTYGDACSPMQLNWFQVSFLCE
jgi:hypothetical protein